MTEHVYKILELVGSSTKGIDAAVANALGRASKTVRKLEWFEVKEIRGHVTEGKVAHTQVVIRIGFRLED